MIGIFDSGVGGLTVYERLRQCYPDLDFVYLADHASGPYGLKSDPELYELTRQNVDLLFRKGCDLVILACNTVSVGALEVLRREWLSTAWPGRTLIGVAQPTVDYVRRLQGDADKQRVVAVFATQFTVQSGYFSTKLNALAGGCLVAEVPCTRLASLIESGAAGAQLRREVDGYIAAMERQLRGRAPDVVLLACTHYVWVERLFVERLPPGCLVVSQPTLMLREFDGFARFSTARRSRADRYHRLFTTGDAGAASLVASTLYRKPRTFSAVGDLVGKTPGQDAQLAVWTAFSKHRQ